eukprot:368810_1
MHDTLYLDELANGENTIFIVAAFEMDSSYVLNGTDYNNLTRTQLISFIPKQILPFKYGKPHRSGEPFQNCTAYETWNRTEKDYVLDLHDTGCSVLYEPYYIMNSNTSRDHPWDSRFTGAHLDKIQRMMFLRYHNFTAIVLRDVFMIHVNHDHHSYSFPRLAPNASWKVEDTLRALKFKQFNDCLISSVKYFNSKVLHEPHLTRKCQNT